MMAKVITDQCNKKRNMQDFMKVYNCRAEYVPMLSMLGLASSTAECSLAGLQLAA